MNHEEMLTLIKTRRSCRPDAVPEDVLDKVLEAGTYAPTGGGRQSPVIIAVRDSKLRSELSAMNAEIMGGDSDPYYGAPVVLLVLAEGNTFVEDGTCVLENLEDGTCVLENLMLAAHAMGLATVWVHREREMFDSEKGKALLREWGLPETLRGVGAVALGYAAQEPAEAAPRKQNYIVKL